MFGRVMPHLACYYGDIVPRRFRHDVAVFLPRLIRDEERRDFEQETKRSASQAIAGHVVRALKTNKKKRRKKQGSGFQGAVTKRNTHACTRTIQ